MKSKIICIGEKAIDPKEPILIFFGNEATPAIKDVSILQEMEKGHSFTLSTDDQIVFGDQVYTIEHVGEHVNASFQSLEHLTLVFKEFDAEHYLETTIYLSPYKIPHVAEGMEINYLSKD